VLACSGSVVIRSGVILSVFGFEGRCTLLRLVVERSQGVIRGKMTLHAHYLSCWARSPIYCTLYSSLLI
jgi:hypothetical protein